MLVTKATRYNDYAFDELPSKLFRGKAKTMHEADAMIRDDDFWAKYRTVELSLGKIYDYKVSYSKYVVLRAERRAQQLAAYENQQRMIEKTEEFIEKFRYKPTKSNQVQSRIKQLERSNARGRGGRPGDAQYQVPPAPRSGQIVAEIDPLDLNGNMRRRKRLSRPLRRNCNVRRSYCPNKLSPSKSMSLRKPLTQMPRRLSSMRKIH